MQYVDERVDTDMRVQERRRGETGTDPVGRSSQHNNNNAAHSSLSRGCKQTDRLPQHAAVREASIHHALRANNQISAGSNQNAISNETNVKFA